MEATESPLSILHGHLRTKPKSSKTLNSMKTRFAAAALAVLMLTSVANADTGEPRKGPLLTYIDCVNHCVDSYGKWTLKRTACAADCYLGIFGSVVSVIANIQ